METVSVRMSRGDEGTAWGFRLQGIHSNDRFSKPFSSTNLFRAPEAALIFPFFSSLIIQYAPFTRSTDQQLRLRIYTSHSINALNLLFIRKAAFDPFHSCVYKNSCVNWCKYVRDNVKGGAEYSQPLMISAVIEGSLADRAGLRTGDQLTELQGRSVRNIPHQEAQNLILAARTELNLQVVR